MSTHPESVHAAVVSVALRAPLEIRHVPTVAPGPSEVRVRVDWVASTPFDLHQSDGGLLAVHPEVLGDGIAGDIVEIGENVKDFVLGDKVSTKDVDRRIRDLSHDRDDLGFWILLEKSSREGPTRVRHCSYETPGKGG